MTGLRSVAERPGLDSTARAAARDSVLHSQHVTSAQMEAAAEALAKEPERAMKIFHEIDRRAAALATPH